MTMNEVRFIVGTPDETRYGYEMTYHLSDGSSVELLFDAKLLVACHKTRDGKIHDFVNQSQRQVAATARTIAPFKRLKIGMYHTDIDALVGKVDTDGGKDLHVGIHNYGYKLRDGSFVYLRYANNLTSVRHQLKNGQWRDLTKTK